jgi:hypothetical protein
VRALWVKISLTQRTPLFTEGHTMTTTERTDRDRRIWQIRDILSRVKPEDMTDAELEAVHAVFGLAASATWR